MISAESYEALPDVAAVAQVNPTLTVEEQTLVYALDAEAEAAAEHRKPGDIFEMRTEPGCTPNVVAALKRAWEAGGWVVGAFIEGECWRIVFARPHTRHNINSQAQTALQQREQAAEELQLTDEDVDAVLEARESAVQTTCPLLVRFPTRARPLQALEVLTQYRNKSVTDVAIEVIIDVDDTECNNTIFLQRLAELNCHVTIGRHHSKIEACNGGRINNWDILLLASDDMVPVTHGWDRKIIKAMDKHWPLRDGALTFNDGYNKSQQREGEPVTCTLPVLGRHVFKTVLNGDVYYPCYRSIYCDTDQTWLLHKLNRIVFVDDVIIEHRHFANDKARFDELYRHNSKHDDHDRNLFAEREAEGFGISPTTLSILICAMPQRRKMLDRLVDYLRWQIAGSPSVEICTDLDTQISVGGKRQRLLERAVGDYVVFVDDDDWVAHDYVARLLKALKGKPDCVALTGVITENGQNPTRFEHSIKYLRWATVQRPDGSTVHERTPNHLNAVRRELALQVGFVPKNVGEDHEFSNRLLPLLRSQTTVGDAPLYYYWSMPERSVQRKGS